MPRCRYCSKRAYCRLRFDGGHLVVECDREQDLCFAHARSKLKSPYVRLIQCYRVRTPKASG
jgi:hypothetical protein